MSGQIAIHPDDLKWAVEPVRKALADPKVRPAFPVEDPEKVADIDILTAALEATPAGVERVRSVTDSSDYMAKRLTAASDIGIALANETFLVVLQHGDRHAPPRARSKWREACWTTTTRSRKLVAAIRKRERGAE